MEQVIMYQCEHCKKFFKTKNRHICKYSKESMNCYSCNNNKGFYQEYEYDYLFDGSEEKRKGVYVNCTKEIERSNYSLKSPCVHHVYCGKWYESEPYKKENYIIVDISDINLF